MAGVKNAFSVRVVAARSVQPSKRGGQGVRDLYVELLVRSSQGANQNSKSSSKLFGAAYAHHKTRTIPKSLAPKWGDNGQGEEFELFTEQPDYDRLAVIVWDAKQSKIVGEIEIPCTQILSASGPIDKWYNLQKNKGIKLGQARWENIQGDLNLVLWPGGLSNFNNLAAGGAPPPMQEPYPGQPYPAQQMQYSPQQAYPPQMQAYPPQQMGYAPPPSAYPPAGYYPPQQQAWGGYPPQPQQPAYSVYPASGYASQGYPPQHQQQPPPQQYPAYGNVVPIAAPSAPQYPPAQGGIPPPGGY